MGPLVLLQDLSDRYRYRDLKIPPIWIKAVQTLILALHLGVMIYSTIFVIQYVITFQKTRDIVLFSIAFCLTIIINLIQFINEGIFGENDLFDMDLPQMAERLQEAY